MSNICQADTSRVLDFHHQYTDRTVQVSWEKNVRTETMSLTVLQKIIVNGVFSFFSFKSSTSQSKQCIFLSAFRIVNRMLSLLGVTTIGFRLLFIPRYFIKRSRMSLLAVAVSPSTGVPFLTNDRNSRTRPKACRNAAFPFFPIPLWKTKKKKLFLMKLGQSGLYSCMLKVRYLLGVFYSQTPE